MLNLTPIILLAPLVGFVVLGVFGRALPRVVIALIGCGVILAAFGFAVADLIAMLGTAPNARVSDSTLWTWISAGTFRVQFGLLSDPLTAVMLLVVTGVGFLIHVYSIGYMEDDPGFWRFFSFLNFFVFAMTLLVAADNFLFLLVGWAGVGLASFLLIGFWYMRPSAVAAARKAFVVNVIGDFGLMIAIFLLVGAFHGALDYRTILGIGANGTPLVPVIVTVPGGTLLAIALMLFVAAAAKSAQLPLHVWLPDAMEGPTPVSALIHAATMVTAGVYLVARAHSLFTAAPDSLVVIAVVAGASAFFAATIACVQTDIKRILAYSTMSQLGYMFMGEAAGGFSSGIFHLVTHAFFKALLFMCAGAVIHALGGEQDIRKMGGLRARLSGVFWLFVVSGLALAAIFPFAGFWSKDAILGAILQRATATGAVGWYALYGVGLLTAGLTGFYIFRLIFVTFFGTYRGAPVVAGHGDGHAAAAQSGASGALTGLHRPGLALMAPMYVLGVLSLVGGALDLPGSQWLSDFLAPAAPHAIELTSALFWISLGAGLICALVGVAIAWARYAGGQIPASDATRVGPLMVFLRRRWFVDDLYEGAIVRPTLALAHGLRFGLEDDTLEASSRGVGDAIGSFSAGLRGLQTGFLRNYTLTLFLGAVVILVYFIAVSQ